MLQRFQSKLNEFNSTSRARGEPKGPCKRSQHCWPIRRNIVGPNMLRAFAHHVVCCCVILRLVGWSLKRLQHVGPNNVASCWPTMLRAFARALKASLLKKKCWIYRFWIVVNGNWSRKNNFNHFLTGWNSFQIPHIYVQAEERVLNIAPMCEFDQNEDTLSVYCQFILINRNITSSKMVRNNILQR